MEISMQMTTKTMISTRFRFRQKLCSKVNVISCRSRRADHLCIQGGSRTNFYKVLSLDHTGNVGLDDIKKAYRSLVLQYHPDVCSDLSSKDECTRRFLELQMAYETLSDPVSRKMHDYELGFGVGNRSMEERISRFSREVWEKQLDGLKRRSSFRLQRMNNIIS